ncbi:MAG: F0F1 ATP synthase subunit delta [Actinomycetota bacterium]
MLIDWFTVVAQLINFAILVVALKYLLYDRVIEAMERRRASIAAREREAEERSRAADERIHELERERRELQDRREEMLAEAGREAAERRSELLGEVRDEVQRREEEWKESIRLRQESLLADLQQLTGEKAVAIAERVLRDLADESMERTLIRRLAERIDELSQEEQSALAEALREEGSVVEVRGGFELSEDSKSRIQAALRRLAGDFDRKLTYRRDPALIAGVVIQVGPRSVGWTMDGYLDDLKAEFNAVLRNEVSPADGDLATDGEGG